MSDVRFGRVRKRNVEESPLRRSFVDEMNRNQAVDEQILYPARRAATHRICRKGDRTGCPGTVGVDGRSHKNEQSSGVRQREQRETNHSATTDRRIQDAGRTNRRSESVSHGMTRLWQVLRPGLRQGTKHGPFSAWGEWLVSRTHARSHPAHATALARRER